MPRKTRFTKIYEDDVWRGAGETRSGAGSTMHATRELRDALPRLLRSLGVTSLLDAGCGDTNWLPDLGGIGYVGVDIVPDAIEESGLGCGG